MLCKYKLERKYFLINGTPNNMIFITVANMLLYFYSIHYFLLTLSTVNSRD